MKIITKLTFMPYAQASVIHLDNGAIQLKSYMTVVAEIDNDGWLRVFGLHSMTTRKHIGAFLKEYTVFDFSTAKRIFENNEKINIFTGELVDL